MEMNSYHNKLSIYPLLLLLALLVCLIHNFSNAQHRLGPYGERGHHGSNKKQKPSDRGTCVSMDETVRARVKTCLLRPDNGPCRSDIVSWYFDARQRRCYRFFWGGCQGNGNRFDTEEKCHKFCYLNSSVPTMTVPFFCSLPFDFGTCFGHYNRWGWDTLVKACKRRLYSGCGGNQNNFETRQECLATCVSKPNNTMSRFYRYTTCIPYTIPDDM